MVITATLCIISPQIYMGLAYLTLCYCGHKYHLDCINTVVKFSLICLHRINVEVKKLTLLLTQIAIIEGSINNFLYHLDFELIFNYFCCLLFDGFRKFKNFVGYLDTDNQCILVISV